MVDGHLEGGENRKAGSRRRGLLFPILLLSLLLPPALPLEAQSGPPLVGDHWARDLVRLLDVVEPEELRWVDGGVPTAAALRPLDPVEEGDLRGSFQERWWEVLLLERPGARAPEDGAPYGISGSFGLRRGSTLLDPGGGAFADIEGEWVGEAGFGVWTHLRWGGDQTFDGFRSGGLFWQGRRFFLGAGRQGVRLGPGEFDPVAQGQVPFDQIQLGTVRPLRLPGPLRWIGPLATQLSVGRVESTGEVESPFYGTFSASVRPHPSLELGATRSAVFAGEGRPGVTTRRILGLLGGRHSSGEGVDFEWEDQYAMAYFRLRGELRSLPVSLHGGVAVNDTEGAVRDDPAVVAGVELAEVLPRGLLSLSYEYSAFGQRARICWWCEIGRRPRTWYDHFVYGRHEVRGIPLGSTLGGYGARHSVGGTFWDAGGTGHLSGRAFFEVREERNLLEGRWPGKRRGLELTGWARLSSEYRVRLSGVVAGGPEMDWDVGGEILLTWDVPLPGPAGL